MPTTYLCEESFSDLVEIKSKKRDSLHYTNSLMREAIEKEIEKENVISKSLKRCNNKAAIDD